MTVHNKKRPGAHSETFFDRQDPHQHVADSIDRALEAVGIGIDCRDVVRRIADIERDRGNL